MDWMKKFKLAIGKKYSVWWRQLIRKETNHREIPEVLQTLNPGHYPVKQKMQEQYLSIYKKQLGKVKKLTKPGHLERLEHLDEKCFVLLVVITVKNDKSVNIASASRKLNESCFEVRPHLPNIEQVVNQNLVEITKDWTKDLWYRK